MPAEKITIAKLGRKQQPSKFKPGETYSITTILDEGGRKLAAMGAWAEGWKVGDVIEGTIEEKKWTDKDGFEQTSLNIKNPNQKPFTPRGETTLSPLVVSYQLAVAVAPLLYKNKKKVVLDDVIALAEKLKEKIDVAPVAEATPEKKDVVPEIDVNDEKPAKKEKEVEEDDDDDDERPF